MIKNKLLNEKEFSNEEISIPEIQKEIGNLNLIKGSTYIHVFV